MKTNGHGKGNGHDILTAHQVAFVEELLRNGGNRSAAYRFAFPNAGSTHAARVNASALAKRPHVARAIAMAEAEGEAAIEAAVGRYAITAERIADELARLAFTRMDQLATIELVDGRQVMRVREWSDVDREAIAAVSRVKRLADGSLVVELGDKRAALMDLARLKGWVADKPQSNGNLVMLKIER